MSASQGMGSQEMMGNQVGMMGGQGMMGGLGMMGEQQGMAMGSQDANGGSSGFVMADEDEAAKVGRCVAWGIQTPARLEAAFPPAWRPRSRPLGGRVLALRGSPTSHASPTRPSRNHSWPLSTAPSVPLRSKT